MSKRPTVIDKAIKAIDAKILALMAAREELIAQQRNGDTKP